ncbi:MAG: rRNA pseudouridine synthase [Clostridiales bacterium]|nr:rRNA pseudouridine synthase [Clostridiales bacterium]
MRIAKFMAQAGAASRRASEELIREGRVRVNGVVISDLGHEVDPENDSVYLGRKKLTLAENKIYLMFNKPPGCVSTCADEAGRKTVLDYIDTKERIYPIGRLDFNSEGLLLLTNDGDLSYRLTHPSHEVQKRYFVIIPSAISQQELSALSRGVIIDDKKTAPAKVKVTKSEEAKTELTITIHEGRNRQVRKMFEAIGKKVIFLKRISIGKINLGELKKGKYRPLTEEEIRYLKSL